MAKELSKKLIFTKPFDFRPDGDWRSIVAYLPSDKPQTVTRECAKKAKAAGAAIDFKDGSDDNTKRKPKTEA